jgi:hypothetical protein
VDLNNKVYRSVWERRIGPSESPIEAAFLDVFCKLSVEHGYEVEKSSSAPAWVIVVEPQRWFGENFRLDFLISYQFFGKILQIAVECDGHDFHERTKEQAKKDRRRDRALQKLGVEVYRFTGSEIFAAPSLCAAEVLDAIECFQTDCVVKAMKASSRKAA